MSTPSRLHPSARYRELADLYRTMHDEGDPEAGIQPAQMFDGRSLLPHAELVGQLVKHYDARTLLDYGAGKGLQYGPIPIRLPDGRVFPDIPSFWGVQVTCYDAGHEPFSTPPNGRVFDAVISTDMLEHCPEEDLDWIIGEMFDATGFFLYANVACYPADKLLPNGENAHVTLQPPAWWNALFERIAAAHGNKPWLLSIDERWNDNGTVRSRRTYTGSIRVS